MVKKQEYEFDWIFFIEIIWIIIALGLLYVGSLLGILMGVIFLFFFIIKICTKPKKK